MASDGSGSSGPYGKDGSLKSSVIDLPLGGGIEEKKHKQLFQPPLLREATNIEVDKTGSLQKRDGIANIASSPLIKSGAVFENPGGQLGYAGAPYYRGTNLLTSPSVGVIKDTGVGTPGSIGSNRSGIYACSIEESPVTRSDEAILHVQTSVYGNSILTVWCVQENPMLEANAFWREQPFVNKCFYMVRERDTGTVTVQPTEVGFINNPRYTHIAVLEEGNVYYWVVVAAPDLNPVGTWAHLEAATIAVSTGHITNGPVPIAFTSGQTSVTYLVAFDMHAPVGNDVAYILAQEQNGAASPPSPVIFALDRTLNMAVPAANSRLLSYATSEPPLHSGAVFCVAGEGVFTAVSNQHGLVGALAGDGNVYFHKYDENLAAGGPIWSETVFAETIDAAPEISVTKACTRLSIGTSDTLAGGGTLVVWGSQFWNTGSYLQGTIVVLPAPADEPPQPWFEKPRAADYYLGSKSFTRTLWRSYTNCFTADPTPQPKEQSQASVFLTTKAFQKSATDHPMIGVGATNGCPVTTKPLQRMLAQQSYFTGWRYWTDPVAGTGAALWGMSPQDQESKHPVGLIVCPEYDYTVPPSDPPPPGGDGQKEFLRPVAKFGMGLMMEAEDVFPLKWGLYTTPTWFASGPQSNPADHEAGFPYTNNNNPARWESPGLSSVWETEEPGELLFAYKSRLSPGVERKVGFDREEAVSAYVGLSDAGGTYFNKPPENAFGGEEVRFNLEKRTLSPEHDSASTYFSGGYLGFFDGVMNGESDPHSSPGRPVVEFYGVPYTYKPSDSTAGYGSTFNFPQEGLEQPTLSPHTTTNKSIGMFSRSWVYEFVLVYAILDEDGQFHRSAPSASRTASNYANAGASTSFGTDAGNNVAVLRYLMPPPTAFAGKGEKTLYLEIYVRSTVRADPYEPNEVNLTQDISNYRLIDRFIPGEQTDLTPYKNRDAPLAGEAIRLTGSHLTPFINNTKLQCGFPFYGERVLFWPQYTRNYDGQGAYLSDGQMLDLTLYTTGGIIENDPTPSFEDIVVANKRMWGLPTNNRSLVWFSKLLQAGKAPEWSAAFTIMLPRGSESLTAIGQMDEKVVLFSRDDIFVVIGDGPNNLGRGGSLSGPTRVSSDVGCVNKNSVVSGSFGVMFQSAKGIYLLGRDMNVTYIGAQVEDEITFNTIVTSAVLYEDKNQVWFSLDTSASNGLWRAVVFDYEVGTWFLFETSDASLFSAQTATLWDNKYTTMGGLGLISQSAPGVVGDGGGGLTPIRSSFKTAWIRLAGLQGFQRVKRAFLLGEHLGGKVQFGAQYNYDETAPTLQTWERTEFVSGGGVLADDPLQVGIHIPKQKCESIRFAYDDEENPQTGAAYAGSVLSSITLTVGMKFGLFKMREEAKK
jgi:hypothetical protein